MPRSETSLSTNAAAELAAAFLTELRQQLSPSKFNLACKLNAMEADPMVCRSHDFCDANMVMFAAFLTSSGREPDIQDDADTALWNSAWSIAKRVMVERGQPTQARGPAR